MKHTNLFSLGKSVVLTVVLMAATRLGAQTGPCGVAIPGKALPDLIVDVELLKANLKATTETFTNSSCALIEGCVTRKGTHDLLRFTTSFANVGNGDLVIGDPNDCLTLFHLSECHNHLHLEDAADYRLWTEQGYQMWLQGRDAAASTSSPTNSFLLSTAKQFNNLLVGRKQGFCMIDSVPYLQTAKKIRKYDLCGGPGAPGNQGIQVGWADVYGSHLDGQWVQIDQLRAGTYILEVQTNPTHVLPEANYSNNYGAIRIDYVPAKGLQPAQVTVLP